LEVFLVFISEHTSTHGNPPECSTLNQLVPGSSPGGRTSLRQRVARKISKSQKLLCCTFTALLRATPFYFCILAARPQSQHLCCSAGISCQKSHRRTRVFFQKQKNTHARTRVFEWLPRSLAAFFAAADFSGGLSGGAGAKRSASPSSRVGGGNAAEPRATNPPPPATHGTGSRTTTAARKAPPTRGAIIAAETTAPRGCWPRDPRSGGAMERRRLERRRR
jgi:hypothetical protein